MRWNIKRKKKLEDYIDKISGIVKNVFQKKLIYLISYKHTWFWLD